MLTVRETQEDVTPRHLLLMRESVTPPKGNQGHIVRQMRMANEVDQLGAILVHRYNIRD